MKGKAILKMQGKNCTKRGPFPPARLLVFLPAQKTADLGNSFLAGLQIYVIPSEAVPEIVASYS